MPNRLNRDQILIRALDLLDSSALDAKDRPSGTIVSTALSIGWLQEALDYFCKKFPFSATLTTAPVSVAQNGTTFAQPADFILDYRNGILLDNDKGRMLRTSLGKLLNRVQSTVGPPSLYTIRGNVIEFRPKADASYSGTLYYYALPAVLTAGVIPTFPDDSVLTDYVWIKGQEWHKSVPPGSARSYAEGIVKTLQAAGLGVEAEEDEIGLDPSFVTRQGSTDWMGS
jgi:hypothetical protein